MKKVLFASTALVAAGLLTAGSASASEKIKLSVGGFSKWWVVGAWQNEKFGAVDSASGVAATGHYNNVGVKGDNEIHFIGSTTLDNGLKIGVQVELEAGGHAETAQNQSTTGDVIDASFAWIESAYGKVLLGTHSNGTALLHVQAPDAAGNWGSGGILTDNRAVAKPGNVASLGGVSLVPANSFQKNSTAIETDDKAEKITYVAPTFYGLTIGGSYIPNLKEDTRSFTNLNQTLGNTGAGPFYGVGALYANTFGGVGVKLSGGYVVGDAGTHSSRWQETSTGLQLSYAGFTLGGSYRDVKDGRNNWTNEGNNADAYSATGKGWDAGLQYASGPYAVSVAYFHSEVQDRTDNPNMDKINIYQLSGKYTLGAGVDILASAGYASFKDEASGFSAGATTTVWGSTANGAANSNSNDGWTVMSGLSLAF
jgi:hypothetical protein